MDKFAYLKCAERKEDIFIKSKFLKLLPQYFKNKYIIKTNPFIINKIEYLDVEGFEIILPLIKEELVGPKSQIIIKDTLFKLEEMGVITALTDIELSQTESKIIFMNGKSLIEFFIFFSIKKVLKFTGKDIKYIEIIIIDNGDDNSTYNMIDAIYEEINYLSIFTNRPEYFEEYSEKIFCDTGLNLQIIEQNKSALREADIIINLSSSNEFNFDYFYKRGSIYIELSNNKEKTLEILRKRQDINIIDDIVISCDNKSIKNSLLEALLFIKSEFFRNFINCNEYPENKIIVNDIFKSYNLNIVGFCQYGNFIRQYKS